MKRTLPGSRRQRVQHPLRKGLCLGKANLRRGIPALIVQQKHGGHTKGYNRRNILSEPSFNAFRTGV
jgi:hypothetical protein